jgi:hypothetical protein
VEVPGAVAALALAEIGLRYVTQTTPATRPASGPEAHAFGGHPEQRSSQLSYPGSPDGLVVQATCAQTQK